MNATAYPVHHAYDGSTSHNVDLLNGVGTVLVFNTLHYHRPRTMAARAVERLNRATDVQAELARIRKALS